MKTFASLVLVLLPTLVLAQASRPVVQPIKPTTLPTTRPVPQITRALVISIDGLRPDLMLRGDTPTLHAMLDRSTYSMWAQTTPLAITLPSHVSMLTGVIPRRHEVEWNADLPLKWPVYPKVWTLFDYAKNCGYSTALIAGKSKFDLFDKPGALDWSYIPDSTKTETADVLKHALGILTEHKPQVMFVHLPSVDNTGHSRGWASPEQMKAIADADRAVGALLKAVDDLGLTGETFVLVTSDHGGAGKTHIPDDPRSRHIPWIATGPGIRPNYDLTINIKLVVRTEDTFATVCAVMGIPINPRVELDGRAVSEIWTFPPKELLRSTTEPTTQP